MKDKLKKVFTNKEFWTALIGCLGLLLSIALSYFSGFKDGILLDNTIRTELIEKAVDDAKNNKKSRNLNVLEYDAIPYGSSVNTDIFVDIGLIINNIVEYKEDLLNFSNTYFDNTTMNKPLFITQDLYDFTNNYYNVCIYSFAKFNTGVALRIECRMCTIGVLSNGSNFIRGIGSSSVYNLVLINNDLSITYASNLHLFIKQVYTDTFYDSLMVYSSSTSSTATTYTFGTYNLQLYDLIDIGAYFLPSSNATQEELEQAYQSGINVGYQSGVIEGINEYKSSQEYKDELQAEFDKGKDEGYEIGYQDRKDSVEDTEDRINSVWTILENAITSVLNVLSFEILPGIPLYICIGVPILLAVLLWFIKMGQS